MGFHFSLSFDRKAKKQLAAKTEAQPASTRKRAIGWQDKPLTRTRLDIKNWNDGINTAFSDQPKNYPIQLILQDIRLDALLTSQIENRRQQVFSCNFGLYNEAGELDEEQTTLFKNMTAYRHLANARLDADLYGNTLLEMELKQRPNGGLDIVVNIIPRTNVIWQKGIFYSDYMEEKGPVNYRELPDFGTWILEFNNGDFGRLNKAVPHVLFKRFAQSCHSEHCEIAGVPPRVLKTNTQDEIALNRAQKMMEDTGFAPWFIIDENEKMEFAQAPESKGEIYQTLMRYCDNQICLLESGAVIGQDTVNGNRSKEESSQEMLWMLVQSDMYTLETEFNSTVLPALAKIGVLKPGLTLKYDETEDIGQLWNMTKDALPYFNVKPEWIKEKFGIEVTEERQTQTNLSAGFFG